MKDFRDLKVWERAHQLTLRVYKVSAHFPREELFGLISQMRRCSASRSERTLRRDVESAETMSFNVSCKLRRAQPANWNTTFCSPVI